jgi:hypothetical protein
MWEPIEENYNIKKKKFISLTKHPKIKKLQKEVP